jgi:hypothetical protein
MESNQDTNSIIMLTEVELSKLTKFSLSKLRADRWKGTGIPAVRCGRSIRYRLSDIEEYLEKNKLPSN